MKREFIRLMENYTAGTASPEEVARLHEVYEYFQELNADDLPDNLNMFREQRLEQMLQSIEKREELVYAEPRSRVRRPGRYMIAALFAVFLVTGLAVYLLRQDATLPVNLPVHWAEVITHNGEQKVVQLPDGSTVHLNASSRVEYPAEFATNSREVRLSGEAFFDVKKDPNSPMLIKTDKMEIQVLGTTLNVRAYPGDVKSETTLLTGSVKIISNAAPERSIMLEPNQKYTEHYRFSEQKKGIQTKASVSPVAAVILPEITRSEEEIILPAPVETEWMLRRLTIRDQTLEEIAIELERWYDVKIRFADSEVGKQKYSARFEDEELETLLKALQVVAPFNYRKEANGEITIF